MVGVNHSHGLRQLLVKQARRGLKEWGPGIPGLGNSTAQLPSENNRSSVTPAPNLKKKKYYSCLTMCYFLLYSKVNKP